jgi:uroporphyrinogen decarboxylase
MDVAGLCSAALPYPGVMSAVPFRDRFLRACRRQPVDRTPVWFMRQAGRYLPEYREVRGDRDILETCKDPEAVAQITMQPLRRMDLDAAIVFSDIMVPLAAIGVPIRIEAGRGPIVDAPIRTTADIERLRALEPSDVGAVADAIALLRRDLTVPLIGFAGAPFTLASYLVEGGPSKGHERTKALMLTDPKAWSSLMSRLADIVAAHVAAQVDAGAQAVQIFDSWVGTLSASDYDASVAPVMRDLFARIGDLGVPLIHFGVDTGHLLSRMRFPEVAVMGVDWRTSVADARTLLGDDVAIQGNLDPVAALAPWDVLQAKASDVLASAGKQAGHIFNLGHGVLPDTPVENLQRLVGFVHSSTERTAS